MKSRVALIVIGTLLLGLVAVSQAQALIRRIISGTPGGVVNLPYMSADNTGNQWMIYQMGWLRQQGNSPTYSQGAMLSVNGAQPQVRTNTGRIDDKTGELVLDDMTLAGLTVSRRMLFDKDEGTVRIIDVFKNPTGQEIQVPLQIRSQTNYGVNSAVIINDPKKKEMQIGWVAQCGNNRTAMEMFSGKGSKLPIQVNYNQGNNEVFSQIQLTVPANKQAALMHFHGNMNSTDQATKWINELKESTVLSGIPKEIRKLIVNFRSSSAFIGDLELLRGDVQDAVELRGGDVLRGTLKDANYKLATSFGEVNLPADKVVSMLNIGQFRPRQLVVTSDGQIFGGNLAKPTIDLELSSGQLTQVPLSQISRVGVRKRAGEPEELGITGPFVLLRSGDRVSIKQPNQPIEVATRYGKLSLSPNSIATIVFQVEEHGVHQITLTDGSKFAGLVSAEQFQMQLADGGTAQAVTFASNGIQRIQFSPAPDSRDESLPSIKLLNDDLMVGSLDGQLKLDTAFDTISLNAPEVRSLSHPKESTSDVQVMLWDQTTLSGQLQTAAVRFKLTSGPVISVPPALIELFNNPMPSPSASMVEQIKKIVAELNADDWKQRDIAQDKLVALGNGVVGTLKELRTSQTPEAQQRIDVVIKQLSKGLPKSPAAAAPVPAAVPMIEE